MAMDEWWRSASLMLVLLNPFAMSIYLLRLIRDLRSAELAWVLGRAFAISAVVFIGFAWMGEYAFSSVLQVRFASFRIFGGLVFLFIGLLLVFRGGDKLGLLRGEPRHLAGGVAMPFVIGPGSVSASVLAGQNLPLLQAASAIAAALAATMAALMLFKAVHDALRERFAALLDRYVDIMGRVTALVAGTLGVDMILSGFDAWFHGGGERSSFAGF